MHETVSKLQEVRDPRESSLKTPAGDQAVLLTWNVRPRATTSALSKMKLPAALGLCLVLSNGFVLTSQDGPSDQVQVLGPFQCQHNEAFLAGLAHTTPADALIIVIARAGQNDTRAALNKRRLQNVRAYLTRFNAEKRGSESIVVAEGEIVKGDGRLEFYVNGKLAAILKLKPNSDLFVGNCYPEPMDASFCSAKENQIFYPCLDQKARRTKRVFGSGDHQKTSK